MSVKIEGYLTEEKLSVVLEASSDIADIVPQFKLPDSRFRIDYFCKLKGKPTCIEYDGHLHYTDYSVIIRDYKVKELCDKFGYDLIRIPYFIQLDSSTYSYYFKGSILEIEQDYKHGFIDSKNYPVSFHMLGYFRYTEEISSVGKILPKVKEEILASLYNCGQTQVEVDTLSLIKHRLNT